MRIDWIEGGTLALECPICASSGPKSLVLRTDSPFPGRDRLMVVRCPSCGAAFYDDLDPPAYENTAGTDVALKFYLEQGAGIDAMIAPLFRFRRDRVRSCLEVGCGFGFSLDFARHAFGWQVRGIDPSPMAAAGRALLGLDITPSYLTAHTALGDARFDVILCSEVIEHVADPHRFLAGIAHALEPTGVLALSTPNAAAVTPGTPDGKLLPILSPGFHFVLFSEAALSHLLAAQGFPHVAVWASPHTVYAMASRQPLDLLEGAEVDRRLYRRYLGQRMAEISVDTPLGLGLAYRLYAEFVTAGEYSEACAVLARLREAYATCYGLDLEDPASVAASLSGAPRTFDEFAGALPFNLTGVLHFRGLAELRAGGDPSRALAYFRAASRAGVCVRSVLRGIGADDGETENLLWATRLCAVYCLAQLDPPAALAELNRLEWPLPGEPSAEFSRVPPELVTVACTRVLAQLVAGRRYRAAARLLAGQARIGGPAFRGGLGLARLALRRGRHAATAGHDSIPGRFSATLAVARRWLRRYSA